MQLSQKTYKRMKDELTSLKLTLESLSNHKLMEKIHRGIEQGKKGQWSRVRDDIKI